MAEPDAAVTDTHALVFHATESPRLGARARAFFQRAEERKALVYVPAAVAWEVGLLVRSGRIDLRRPLRQFFDDLFSNPSYQPHPLEFRQVFEASDLTLFRDPPSSFGLRWASPFDALIRAAALDLGLPLLSRDQSIAATPRIKTIW